jgi:hypothetical protein
MPTGPELNDDRFRNFRMSMQGRASEVGTATATAGAATLADLIGIVTTEALTTAQNALYTLTITNSRVAAADWVAVTIGNGTNTAGTPTLHTVTVTASTITIIISNQHASAVAFNGTLKVYFEVLKAL